MSAIASPIEVYAMQQRQRLEAIRAATERERELLNERASATDHFLPSSSGGAARGGVLGSPSSLRAGGGGGGERSLVLKERDELRSRAEALGEQLAKVRQQEHEMASEEAEVDRRLQRAADKKRDLLAQLRAIQLREEDLRNRDVVAEGKENSLRQRSEEVRVRQRDALNQLATVKAEVSQREILFVSALKKHNDKAAEQQRVLQRMRQQIADMEGRVRTMEMQINIRARAIDDMEREAMRSEMTLRDDEMHTIEALRRDIDNRKAALAAREITLGGSVAAASVSPQPGL